MKLKVSVINLIVFDVDKHSSTLTSSRESLISRTRLCKPAPSTSTQITGEGDSNQNPQAVVDEATIRSQESEISNFTPPSTKSAVKQKSFAGMDTSAGVSHHSIDYSSRRKRRCKIVSMIKRCKLKNFYFLLNCLVHTIY